MRLVTGASMTDSRAANPLYAEGTQCSRERPISCDTKTDARFCKSGHSKILVGLLNTSSFRGRYFGSRLRPRLSAWSASLSGNAAGDGFQAVGFVGRRAAEARVCYL